MSRRNDISLVWRPLARSEVGLGTGEDLGDCGQFLRALCVQCAVAQEQIWHCRGAFRRSRNRRQWFEDTQKKWKQASNPDFPLRQ